MVEKGLKEDEKYKHFKIEEKYFSFQDVDSEPTLATHVDASFPKPICASASSLMQLLSTFL